MRKAKLRAVFQIYQNLKWSSIQDKISSSKLSFPNSRDRKLWQLLRKVVRRAGISIGKRSI